jgi:hypothetical protein
MGNLQYLFCRTWLSLLPPDWIPFITAGTGEISVFLLVPTAKTQAAPGDLMADHREALARQAGLDLLAIHKWVKEFAPQTKLARQAGLDLLAIQPG